MQCIRHCGKKDGQWRIGYQQEVMPMFSAAWLMLSSLLYSLQLSTGSFPKPLTEEEEHHYLALAAQGDLEARNVLIERNLRLVAHIMKKY
jgi:RNA polymerase sporulation-specific sigma factor